MTFITHPQCECINQCSRSIHNKTGQCERVSKYLLLEHGRYVCDQHKRAIERASKQPVFVNKVVWDSDQIEFVEGGTI